MSRSLVFAVLVTLLLLVSPAGGGATEGRLPADSLDGLTRVVRDLAREGAADEANELLEILASLGLPDEDRERATSYLERYSSRTPPQPGSRDCQRLARKLSHALGMLSDEFLALDEASRRAIAPTLLKIDAKFAPAHEALGDERVGDRWLSAGERKRAKRGEAFQGILTAARRLEVPVESLPPEPVLARATGEQGGGCRCGTVEIYGPHEPGRLTRMLREALRAAAVANWLLTSDLSVPAPSSMRFYEVRSKAEYEALLDAGVEAGWFDDAFRQESRSLSSNSLSRDGCWIVVGYDRLEVDAESSILDYLLDKVPFENGRVQGEDFQVCLLYAIVNLACLAYLGTTKPSFVWTESSEESAHRSRAGLTEEEGRLVRRFPEAGLMGHRRRMVYLVREGRDPPWARSMVEQEGMLEGDELIEATLMVEYLALDGPLLPLCLATIPTKMPADSTPPVQFEAALGRPLAEVEAGFRRWLLDEGASSLMDRLLGDGRSAWDPPEDVTMAIAALNRVRSRADPKPAGPDEVLCRGARLHAAYLARHPDQAERWPDAHEEYPDREGFSAEGAWSGAHSVIAPGTDVPGEAVQGWMGTFYHRLPLLEPGLLLVGWGEEAGMAVLDAGLPDDNYSRALTTTTRVHPRRPGAGAVEGS